MIKFRKGELKLYQSMNPIELEKYVNQFPENTDYVKSFLENHEYNWVKEEWKKGKTI